MEWRAFIEEMCKPRWPVPQDDDTHEVVDGYWTEIIDTVTQDQCMDEYLAEIFEKVTLVGEDALHYKTG